jgi:hypothetical protein
MKRLIPLLVLAGALALLALPMVATSAPASITVGTSTCAVVDSNENCVPGPFMDVLTSNANGVEIERAYMSGVFNDTGRAIVFTPADFPELNPCGSDVTGALTSKWVETLSASGHATIVCRFTS